MPAALKHLVILDVDGTLVESLRAEADLYPRACEQALLLSNVSSDWTSYSCPSDRGIVRELVERNCARAATAEDYLRVERRFLALIQQAYEREQGLCQPVAGAIRAVERLRQLPELALAIATAGWTATAQHKLAVAGFSVDDLTLMSSRDAEAKVDIMRIAAAQAASRYQVDRFESVVCFGDSAGDAGAASSLGYEFIGIDTSGFLVEVAHRYADFLELDAILTTLGELQKPRVSRS
jgi:phosphoglycolate phosphatase-like HAD superfamily hydrolase